MRLTSSTMDEGGTRAVRRTRRVLQRWAMIMMALRAEVGGAPDVAPALRCPGCLRVLPRVSDWVIYSRRSAGELKARCRSCAMTDGSGPWRAPRH